ncbi:MAG TPA: hypothetical protein VLV56_17180 [Burkholderiales bacterium]|nr:hypothetical protein [Burkholderiales bacterium]HUP09018.1 hypothetical protein [Caldimonas sp.]
MTRAQRWGWVILAIAAALILLFLTRTAAAQDFSFMPKGGRTLLLGLLGAPASASELRTVVQSRRSEAEWRAFLEGRGTLSERERATLAAYLEVNMPLAPDVAASPDLAAALPPDGRSLAETECQSCHSIFSSYLTQSRDAQGWRNVFLSPFHKQLKMAPAQREEFARYSALNMPMKVDDVPPDLRF